jgi:hypothetical protein
MVMQVKTATFQRMGSGEKGRTENRGYSLHHRKCILYFYGKSIKKSAAGQSDDRSVPGDDAECCSVSEISI